MQEYDPLITVGLHMMPIDIEIEILPDRRGPGAFRLMSEPADGSSVASKRNGAVRKKLLCKSFIPVPYVQEIEMFKSWINKLG